MKDFLFSEFTQFRYERKFYIRGMIRQEIESMLKFHPASFSEIFYPRRVNNIYFDSFSLGHYLDNINGETKRLKVRIRWYGELFGFIERPALELKLKHNLHIGKLSYQLSPFALDNNFSISAARDIFKNSPVRDVIKLHLMELNFSMLNCYKRRYFLSADHKYRVTVDSEIQAYRLSPYQNSFLDKTSDDDAVVLEIKYDTLEDDFVNKISNYFPFRMTRNSKYVDGLSRLYA